MLCFIQPENCLLFLGVILLFWIYVYLIKFKSLGINKSCGFVYGSASGQVHVILFFLQLSSGHHLARAAGYFSTPTGTIESGQNVSRRYNTRQTR